MATKPRAAVPAKDKLTLGESTLGGRLTEARDRLAAAQSTGADSLDLSFLSLAELPAELFELRHLRRLSLNRNALTRVPDEIAKLAELQHLDLEENTLEHRNPQRKPRPGDAAATTVSFSLRAIRPSIRATVEFHAG